MTLGSFRLIADPNLVDTVEDWSGVRSRARAERRRRQGHPQRVRYVQNPRPQAYVADLAAMGLGFGQAIIAHPTVINAIRERAR